MSYRKFAAYVAARRADVYVLGVLALLPLVFMWDYVLGRTYLHYLDFTLQWLPWQKFALDSLHRREAPFWNPYLMLGFSQLGESQVGLFYPWNILTAGFDVHFRLVVIVCLHLALANVGMYFLVRHFGLARGAAFVGAVSYGLSGYLFAQITNYVIPQCSAYLPLMILFVTRYLETRRWLELAWFSLLVAANILISHAGTTFMLLGGVSIYFLVSAVRSDQPVQALAFYAGAVLLGVVFASIQVFPTLELKPLSERQGALSLRYVTDPRFTGGLFDRLSFFFPWMLGDSRGKHPFRVGYEEIHQYAGSFVPVLAFAAFAGWRQREQRERRFLLAIAVTGGVAFALCLGGKFPLVNPWAVLARLPGFSMFRIPARWGCIATFALSVFAAFGVQALVDGKLRTRVLSALAFGLPTLAVAAAALQEGAHAIGKVFSHPRPIIDAPANALERWLIEPLSHASPLMVYLLFVLPFLCLHQALRRGWLDGRRFVGSVGTLLVLDLFLMESPTNPRLNNRAFFDADQAARLLGADQRYCRIATTSRNPDDLGAFPMNTAAFFGIFSVTGDTPLELARYMTLERALRRKEVLDYIGACYGYDGHGFVPRPDALPRAFVVSDVRGANGDPLRAFLKLPAEQMRAIAYLEPAELEGVKAAVDLRPEAPEQSVSITRFENSRVELDVKSAASGLLVLTDMNYPGWNARLDGRKARLFAAQGAFRSVVVPAGTHHVTFEYRARSLYYGAALSALSLLGFAIACIRQRSRSARAHSVA